MLNNRIIRPGYRQLVEGGLMALVDVVTQAPVQHPVVTGGLVAYGAHKAAHKLGKRAYGDVWDQAFESGIKRARKDISAPKDNGSQNSKEMAYRRKYKGKKRKYKKQLRKNTRRRRRRAKSVSKSQVARMINRQIKLGPVTHHRSLLYGNLVAAENLCNYKVFDIMTSAACENMMATYGPHMVGPNAAHTATTSEKIELDHDATNRPHVDGRLRVLRGTKKVVSFRNNSEAGARVSFYWFIAKSHQSASTLTLFTNTVHTKHKSSPSATNPLWFPHDFMKEVKQAWKCYKSTTVILNPAEQIDITLKAGKGVFDSQYYNDNSTPTYTKGVSGQLLVRVEGLPAHGATATNVGLESVTIDYISKAIRNCRAYTFGGLQSAAYNTGSLASLTAPVQMQIDVTP